MTKTISHGLTTAQPDNPAYDVSADEINQHVETYAGLTAGHVMRASGATAADFAAIQDGDLPASIARDAEVTAAVNAAIAALASVYQPVDGDLTSIAALTTTSFGRGLLGLANAGALLAAAGGAAASHAHSGADITSGTVADARVDAALARDSEVSTAVSTHAATPHGLPSQWSADSHGAVTADTDNDTTPLTLVVPAGSAGAALLAARGVSWDYGLRVEVDNGGDLTGDSIVLEVRDEDDNVLVYVDAWGYVSIRSSPDGGGGGFDVQAENGNNILVVGSGADVPSSFVRSYARLGLLADTAPADGDLFNGEVAFWFDDTDGLAGYRWKGKSADGTVTSGLLVRPQDTDLYGMHMKVANEFYDNYDAFLQIEDDDGIRFGVVNDRVSIQAPAGEGDAYFMATEVDTAASGEYRSRGLSISNPDGGRAYDLGPGTGLAMQGDSVTPSNAVPTDGAQPDQMQVWYDATSGSPSIKVRAKADGVEYTATIPLTPV